ncbi:nucleotidyltransferase family protein [Hoeflea sp. TYP-13]|uniref:nucleotidyltransferase family protein n=1 Tax=Hoeflea sp. TYP-13 TaxID=3230023 RepID=UPI0034C67FF5
MRATTKEELKQVLRALADPQASAPPTETCLNIAPQDLFDAVRHHGIEPAALPKLLEALPQEPPYVALIDGVRERQFLANAKCLNLEAHAKRIMLAIEGAGLQAKIVKGPVFTSALYEKASDRPFTDIDILAHPSAVRAIAPLLKDAGFFHSRRWIWDKSRSHMEQKWVLLEDPAIVIELHGNLVHNAGLRRHISFGFDEYMTVAGGGDFPAAAHFMTAVIHASASHKFNRLQLLVDVLQAVRRLEDRDVEHLDQVLDQLGARLEALVCLDLVDALFDNFTATQAQEKLSGRRDYRRCRRLVTADAVFDTWNDRGHRSSMRRNTFRLAQHVVPRS